jgi:MSHA biogenesis protein MshO
MIELIVVIVIISILAAGGAKFIANPTQSYFDVETNANLTDRADTALRTMARNIRNALPNSLRLISGANPATNDSLIEFIPTLNAGRYRTSVGNGGTGDPLDFTANGDTFDILGPAMDIATGNELVIYNLGPAVPGSNAYETTGAGTNRRTLTPGNNLTALTFTGTFGWASPGSRFYIIATPVTYACNMATNELIMYSNYAIQPAQPANIAALDALANVRKSVLADNVTSCYFNYNIGFSQHNGILNATLTLSERSANVRLMHQINVVNIP